jgi:hypothetical protein
MGDGWYYVGPEGRVGPIALQGLKTWLATGADPERIVVWRENAPKWQCAADVPELRTQAPARVGVPANPPVDGDKTATMTAKKSGHHVAAAGLLLVLTVILLGCGLLYLGAR